MALDNFKRVLFNDGEGLSHTDLNDSQGFAASRLFDQIIGKLLPGDPTLGNSVDPNAPNQFNFAHQYWALALSVHGGHIIQGSANNKAKFAPGTLFQVIGTDTGNEPVTLAYTCTGSETEFTIANGSGTGNRFDLIQMKLEYVSDDLVSRDFEDATTRIKTSTSQSVKRRVQATFSVKSGAHATTPQVPDCDAGYVAVAMLTVGSAWTGSIPFNVEGTGTNEAFLADLRMPIRVRAHKAYPKAAMYDTTKWTGLPTATNIRALKANATTAALTDPLLFLCPVNEGRILGVAITSRNGTATANYALAGRWNADLQQIDVISDITTALNTTSSGKTKFVGINVLESWEAFGLLYTRSATQNLGFPVWAKGSYMHFEPFKTGAGTALIDEMGNFAVIISSFLNMEIADVTFYVAEGW